MTQAICVWHAIIMLNVVVIGIFVDFVEKLIRAIKKGLLYMSLFKRSRITKDNIIFTRIENKSNKTEIICKSCLHHVYSIKNNTCSICLSKVNIEFRQQYRKIITVGYVII